MLHASLRSFGDVDGGAAMVIHRLVGVLGKSGTLMMPTFTYVTTHGNYHEDGEGNHTVAGCWCEGQETRHIPFIPEVQPDKRIGEIAHRLCSWPGSRRSRHPSYSFVTVGRNTDQLMREHPLMDPLLPVKKMLKGDSHVLAIGVGFDSVTAIHLAEERKTPSKMEKQLALAMTSRGQVWVEVLGLGCSNGFTKLKQHVAGSDDKATMIGLARAELYSMKSLVDSAEALLSRDPMALACDRDNCLSCALAAKRA